MWRPRNDEHEWRIAAPEGRLRHRRTARRIALAALLVMAGLIFRRAVAAVALAALTAALHAVGVNVRLPDVRFAWPWQAIRTGTTTDTDLGPWVLQKIQGITRPALGVANFSFVFTHTVSKNIGPWPCWYSATFYAVGHAAATVDLNPGPAWWRPSTGHYRLQVVERPGNGAPGRVSVTMALPRPLLPRSVHEVTIDDIGSKPIATRHSWTYPGIGCGVLIRPQFAASTLYAEAQRIAFTKATDDKAITGPLVSSAESAATRIVRDDFIQPTVNAFDYTVSRFTVDWVAGP